MKLTLENLKEAGAFTGAPVEKEITWKQGETEYTATVYVRPLSYQAAVNDLRAIYGKTDGVAGRIAASICDEHGKQVFTAEDITDGPIVKGEDGKPMLGGDGLPQRTGGALDGNLTMALLQVIGEVNNPGKPKTSAS
ncbi:hypothetical protein BAY1663_02351 [Pseudomonas sp. BAY1663]|uniref:phage tail assembly chaperone family protein, TAC n=1 Tax=Pseudomonas sp. BAY1663 TaxID=1439940 RepID=UPI00042E1354|nr:phage tail assembly chaperone family protein, TAC [Pseudomonas sp. BAY1663]EXF45272.1 hypothetical protein BAY1663_02351 [Pseudomonas sp. BAY1663]